MYDPESYDTYSPFQRQDAQRLIPKIISRMNWGKADRLLDYGCGSGFVTKNILIPLLPCNDDGTQPLIYGVDLSKKND